MSWNPLRKITSSFGQSSTPATPSAPNPDSILVNISGIESFGGSNTTDGVLMPDEVNKLTLRVDSVDSATKKIHKSGKKLMDSIIKFSRHECKLSEDLANSLLCQQYYPEFRELVQDWHTFNSETSEFGDNLGVAIQKMIVDPTKKLQSILTDVKNELNKHKTLSESLTKLNSKVSQLNRKEKTGNVFVALEKTKAQLAETEEKFEKQSKLITGQIPAIIDYRIKYFQPCLEGLIKSELLFWGDSFATFNSHSTMTNESQQRSTKNWNDYAAKQNQLLSSISSLSIVGEKGG
ncbi:uncharacterized protein LOC107365156 [Tetranychus urticae]|nr:uncharacterized protein LOC107365156 [Tetranychus urticae]